MRVETGHDLWGEAPERAWSDYDHAHPRVRGDVSAGRALRQRRPVLEPGHARGRGGSGPFPSRRDPRPRSPAECLAGGSAGEGEGRARGGIHVVLTPSYATAQALSAYRSGAVDVVPNGVPDGFFSGSGEAAHTVRRDLGLPLDAVVCLSAARMDHEKGWDLLLAAVLDLADRDALGRLHFLWAGDGTLRRRLDAVIRLHGLSSRVRVLGVRDDMAALVGASDIAILPTRRDAAPLAIIEAMAGRLAVVTTRAGDLGRIVGDAGIILPLPHSRIDADDVQRLAAAVASLDADDALRIRLRRACSVACRREPPRRERWRPATTERFGRFSADWDVCVPPTS